MMQPEFVFNARTNRYMPYYVCPHADEHGEIDLSDVSRVYAVDEDNWDMGSGTKVSRAAALTALKLSAVRVYKMRAEFDL